MRADVNNTRNSRIYNISFHNMTDLYDYIKSNPKINTRVFTRPASMSISSFYGESLEKSTEYLISGYNSGFNNFLTTSNSLKKIGMEENNSYQVVRSIHGGVPLASLVAAGVHDCMLSSQVDAEARVVNIHFSVSYPAITKDDQIINRGLATLFIVQALEEKGYIVNFNAFQVSKSSDEIIYITVNLKQPSDLFLNIQKCYYPIRGKEFLRRILFRVLESSDVENRAWGENYGKSLPLDEIKIFLKKQNNSFVNTDLLIGDPINMGVTGENLYADTLAMIKTLKIEDEFDVESIKRKIR